jgi:hypothetical protein
MSGSFSFLESSGPVNGTVEGLMNLTLNILLERLKFLEFEADKFKEF